MSKYDLIDKTEIVISHQDNVTRVLKELKQEVKDLRDKNTLLEKELALYKTPTKVSDTIVVKDESLTRDVPKEVKVKEVKKEVEREKIVIAKRAPVKTLISDKNKTKVYEFFLGKNVILKIASVLFFLGFVTFGRMAYITWLNDLGKVMLIFGVGLSVAVVGYVFEKKRSVVFSGAFYVTAVMLMYLSLVLSHKTYGLIGYYTAIYLSIVFIGLVFAYFYKRRYDFLDTFLFVFYVFIVGYITVLGYELELNPEVNMSFYHMGISILMLQLGYISYMYIINYLKSKNNLTIFGVIAMEIYLITAIVINSTPNISPQHLFNSVQVLLFGIFFIYLINFRFLNQKVSNRLFIVLSSLTLLISNAIHSDNLIREFTELNPHNTLLWMIIMVLPIYVYLYIIDKTKDNELSKIDLYGVIIVYLVIKYIFNFEGLTNTADEIQYYVHHLVFGIATLLIYLFYRYNNKLFYKYAAVTFFAVLSLASLDRFFTVTLTAIQDNSHMNFFSRTDYGNSEYVIYIASLVTGILILTVNKLYGKFKNNEIEFDSIILYGFNLFLTIPIIFLIVDFDYWNELNRYSIVLLSSFGYMFILYRYVLNFKIFKIKQLPEFKIFNQLLITGLVLIIDFIYFDHNFRETTDVLVFIAVLALNGYIIVSLKEVFDYFKNDNDFEKLFILLYGVGVYIQSMFIHRYINFTYDKVFLTSYFIIAAALAVLFGFKHRLKSIRLLGLGAIYFALSKFFIYDFLSVEFTLTVRMFTYFILSGLLFVIAFMYGALEKKYKEEDKI